MKHFFVIAFLCCMFLLESEDAKNIVSFPVDNYMSYINYSYFDCYGIKPYGSETSDNFYSKEKLKQVKILTENSDGDIREEGYYYQNGKLLKETGSFDDLDAYYCSYDEENRLLKYKDWIYIYPDPPIDYNDTICYREEWRVGYEDQKIIEFVKLTEDGYETGTVRYNGNISLRRYFYANDNLIMIKDISYPGKKNELVITTYFSYNDSGLQSIRMEIGDETRWTRFLQYNDKNEVSSVEYTYYYEEPSINIWYLNDYDNYGNWLYAERINKGEVRETISRDFQYVDKVF